jgi:hypothetical protein
MDQKELNATLDYLQKLSNEDPAVLKKKIYETMSTVSFLILEAKAADYKKGWASELLDRHGEHLFDKEESHIIEDAALKFIKPLFIDVQKGGLPSLKQTGTPSILQSSIDIDPEQISLDNTFWKIRDYFTSIDTQVKSLSRELGPFRFFYEMDRDIMIPMPVPLPAPPFVGEVIVPINPRAFPILISFLIETIRIIFSFGPLSNDLSRKTLSLVLAIVDLIKGDWKQGILSAIGYFGQSSLLAGLTGKVFINLLELVSPDLQERIVMDLYQSGKSKVIGILLWGFVNFAPEFAREIARQQFDMIREMITNANGDIQKIEQSMQRSVGPMGLKIKFNEIPESFIPTFDDIQNIQAIVRQPEIYCSMEFQEAIQPLRKVPPMRLVLELLNIPTDPRTLAFECKDHAGKSIESTLEAIATPQLTPGSTSEVAATPTPPVTTNPTI